jgi:hypothetical protein
MGAQTGAQHHFLQQQIAWVSASVGLAPLSVTVDPTAFLLSDPVPARSRVVSSARTAGAAAKSNAATPKRAILIDGSPLNLP